MYWARPFPFNIYKLPFAIPYSLNISKKKIVYKKVILKILDRNVGVIYAPKSLDHPNS